MKRFKDIKCRVCGSPCKSGKRRLCPKHYAEELSGKAKAKPEKEKKAPKAAKPPLKKKPRKSAVGKLEVLLDEYFSKFIRLRDTNADGVGFCIDCGVRMDWSEIECGHFASRGFMNTRWDEMNSHAQHYHCNRGLSGRQFEYGKALDIRYGEGTAEALLQKSKQIKKWTQIELKEMLTEYQQKVKALLQKKNFQPWATK